MARRRLHPDRRTWRRSRRTPALPATNPLGSSYYLEPFLDYGIQYSQPNFNNPQVGYLVRQLYIRQAMQYAENQPGISKAIWRGYATPDSGPVPTVPSNQFEPAIEKENGGRARTRTIRPRRSRC